jgi:cephalosporin-C deacetylase
MHYIDSKLSTLAGIRPNRTALADYDAHWERMLAAHTGRPPLAERTELPTELIGVRAYKVVYEGYADTPVHGIYMLPPNGTDSSAAAPPCLVSFHGYTGSKGDPEDYAAWLLRGYAVFAVDVRGQSGETGNTLPSTYGMTKGWITQGILDKDTCYYKAIMADALRAVEWVLAQPEIDSDRVIAMGGSQGGGIVLLTAAFHPRIRAAVADIPNMCQMDFGIFNSTGSLSEAAEFVNRHPEHLERVLGTLSYYDAVNCAERIACPILVSAGLKDSVCWPETIYAAYHAISSTHKQIVTYPFAGHYTGAGHHRTVHEFLKQHLA